MSQRKAVTLKKAAAYRAADRAGESRILDELVELTGWHRDYCRAAIRATRPGRTAKPAKKPRAPRSLVYGPAVVGGLEVVIARFPFPIVGIDSDNGSEFINHHLFDYCQANKITFTRSRAANSNDGAHVEQKNWTHVRTLVGYLRYDSADELDLLNDIWELDAGFTNLLSAQQKLVSKRRDGPKVIKHYDQATTPHRRLETFPGVSESVTGDLDRQLAATHPGHLSRQIDSLVQKLATIASPKPQHPSNRASTGHSSTHPSGENLVRQRIPSRRY